jgi:hypothetical protein
MKPINVASRDCDQSLFFITKVVLCKECFCFFSFLLFIASSILIHGQVLKAWADSGHPNASEKMEIILQNMRQSGIGKSPTTYRILIRFWAGQLDIDMVEKLLQSMKLDGTPPCRLSLSEAIYCYCRKGETKIAQSLLNELLEVEPTCAIDRVLPSRCAQCIMLEFRDIVDSASNENKYRKHRALESAEELYKNFSSLPGIDDESKGERFIILHVDHLV